MPPIVTLSITILMAMRVWRNAPPAVLVGGAVGHGVSKFLDQQTFRAVVLATLAATGLYMPWTTWA